MLEIMIRLSNRPLTCIVALLLLLAGGPVQAQCDFIGTVTVTTSAYQTDTDYSHQYVLVDDASDEILSINTTGTFSNLSGAEYRVYAVNYRDAQPAILATGNTWAAIATYDSDSDNCFDASAAYNGGAITVCEQICDGTNIAVSTSGHYSGSGYSQTFVLVNAAGTILADNTTGTFTDSDYSGTGEYNVYAVNTDEAATTAEIADGGAWADVVALADPATCTKIIGPRIFGVEACCTAPTVSFATVPNCASNQFGIEVDVTALGDAASVNIKHDATTYQSSVGVNTYNFGTYASGSQVVITVEDAADATCTVVSDTLSFTCLTLPVCDLAGGTSTLIDENFSSAPSGWVTSSWSNGTSAGSYPMPAGNGNYCYINDGNTNVSNTATTMYSPAVNAAGVDSLGLSFDYTFREYSSLYDDAFTVQVYDGATWHTVYTIGGSAHTDNQSWTTETVNVTAYANASFQVRFVYTDDGGWCYWVGVDNVSVVANTTSSDPDVMLPASTGTVTAFPQCNLGNWTYYAVDAASQYVFAINWEADGSLSNNNQGARDASNVALTVDPAYYSVSNLTNGQEEATFTMKRYWNVNFSTSGSSMDEAVNVRFFYDDAEKSMIESQSASFASTYTDAVDEGFAWFKTTSGDFAPGSNVNATQVSGVIALTNLANGTENGHTYVQFNSLTGFSGGTGASGAGPLGTGGPLPVELLDVSAHAEASANVVLWETASEQNTELHVVERSADGETFEVVGEVAAAGDSDFNIGYRFNDERPISKAYYRIRTIDADGSHSVSNMAYVEREVAAQNPSFELWPNPSNGQANFRFNSSTEQSAILRIATVDGQVVAMQQLQANEGWNTLSIDLIGKSAGMYVATLQLERGQTSVKKLIKE